MVIAIKSNEKTKIRVAIASKQQQQQFGIATYYRISFDSTVNAACKCDKCASVQPKLQK